MNDDDALRLIVQLDRDYPSWWWRHASQDQLQGLAATSTVVISGYSNLHYETRRIKEAIIPEALRFIEAAIAAGIVSKPS